MQEERDRQASRPRRDLGRRVDHPMRVRHPAVVAPAHHEITDIDHEAVRLGDRVDPGAGAVLDLQPARHVFALQDRQGAVVGMRRRAQLAGQRLGLLAGILEHPEHADMAVDLGVEEALRQVEPEREDAHQAGRQIRHHAEIFGPGGRQIGQLARP